MPSFIILKWPHFVFDHKFPLVRASGNVFDSIILCCSRFIFNITLFKWKWINFYFTNIDKYATTHSGNDIDEWWKKMKPSQKHKSTLKYTKVLNANRKNVNSEQYLNIFQVFQYLSSYWEMCHVTQIHNTWLAEYANIVEIL